MAQPASQSFPPLLFGLGASQRLAAAIAAELDLELSAHEERDFVDGEHKVRPLVEVGNRDVYVVHSLAGGAGQSPNDRLIRLLFFLTNAAMLAIAFGWTIVWNWPALALLGWLVFRARRDLAVVSRRMHWITREDASGRTD